MIIDDLDVQRVSSDELETDPPSRIDRRGTSLRQGIGAAEH